ncbi:oligosaccharide flippase family protein [Bacillus thuringiensis]|uniref:oligosaccharide flippase family protein n=1 Tax=Bacillus thuringiensis TaxID=1428 RepID=UPI000BFC5D28|nr:oligosaccharide flippase family protein [Bacillus thuringiensis]EKS8363652.1 oligosaccharide flippase family protein [Bacillus cereus]PGL27530.1 hypothetical protein CN916_20930 [Bacillus thuringiensis]
MIKDSLYMMVTMFVRIMANTLLFIVLARTWGVEGFGQFMFCFTIGAILVVIVDYGFGLKLVKDISKKPNKIKEYVNEAFYSKVILTIFLLILSYLSLYTFEWREENFEIFFLLLVSHIFWSFGTFLCLPLRSLSYFNVEAKINLYGNIVHILIVMISLYMNADKTMVAVAFICSRLFNFVYAYRVYMKYIGKIAIKHIKIKKIILNLKQNFPYAIHLAIGTLYFQVDTIVVQYYIGNTGLGLHQAGIKILTAGLIFSDALTNVYITRLSKVESNEKLIILGTQMNTYMLLVGGLLSIGVINFADLIINIMYGESFISTIPLLYGFAITLFLRYFAATHGAVLTISNKQGLRALGVTLSLLINVLCNVLLIPRFGLKGALLSGMITVLFLNTLYFVAVYRLIRSVFLDKKNILLLILYIILLILSFAYLIHYNIFIRIVIWIIVATPLIIFLSIKMRGVKRR